MRSSWRSKPTTSASFSVDFMTERSFSERDSEVYTALNAKNKSLDYVIHLFPETLASSPTRISSTWAIKNRLR